MTYLDIFNFPSFDKSGPTYGDIDVVSGNLSLALPLSGIPHYHAHSVRVRSGATLILPSAVGGSALTTWLAILYVGGDVLIEGTISPLYPAPAPGPVASVNWDAATAGGDGSTTPPGGSGGILSSVQPTLHQVLYNGKINSSSADYRYFHLMRHWIHGGGGGRGWSTVSGSANVNGGAPGGSLVIMARGRISMANTGLINCKGANGNNAPTPFAGAVGGGGGGGGGLCGLISWTEIELTAGGLVNCNGGNGGNGAVAGVGPTGGRVGGAGGGGGGGMIFAIAPLMNLGLGTVVVNAGKVGTPAIGGGALNGYGGGGGGSFGVGGQAGDGGHGNFFQFPASSGSSQRGQSQWIGV